MSKHSVVGAVILGLSLSVAGHAAADKPEKEGKVKKKDAADVPELGTEGVAAAALVLLAGTAVLVSRRRRVAAE